MKKSPVLNVVKASVHPKPPAGKTKPPSRGEKACQLRISLTGSSPEIWRRVSVPADIDLASLHDVIQTVMGWSDSHLHQFIVKGVYFADPEQAIEEAADESLAKLCAIAPEVGSGFIYEYDFGDGWEHEITVEKIGPIPPEQPSSVYCLDGKRACPPEDSGGVEGYKYLCKVIADPEHPEHEDMLDWLGDGFDPDAFDLEEINALFMTSSGSKKKG